MKEAYFKNKIVLITGASRGIGKAIAESLCLNGAKVIANYNKSEKEATSMVELMQSKGLSMETFRADVTNGKEVERMVDEIVNRYKRIDILINNAGIKRDAFLALMNDEDWEAVINTNLTSIYHVTKWVSRVMMRHREGNIINISSLSAFKGLAGQTSYAASKGGVVSFTRAAARELSRFGIRVNAIAPGLIETDILKSVDQEVLNGIMQGIPLGRIGTVSDIVGPVLFLASDRSCYITGQTFLIDGGLGI